RLSQNLPCRSPLDTSRRHQTSQPPQPQTQQEQPVTLVLEPLSLRHIVSSPLCSQRKTTPAKRQFPAVLLRQAVRFPMFPQPIRTPNPIIPHLGQRQLQQNGKSPNNRRPRRLPSVQRKGVVQGLLVKVLRFRPQRRTPLTLRTP